MTSLCSLGWSKTHSVAWAALNSQKSSCFSFPSAGMQVWATKPAFFACLWVINAENFADDLIDMGFLEGWEELAWENTILEPLPFLFDRCPLEAPPLCLVLVHTHSGIQAFVLIGFSREKERKYKVCVCLKYIYVLCRYACVILQKETHSERQKRQRVKRLVDWPINGF